jgi:hypothetical protein
LSTDWLHPSVTLVAEIDVAMRFEGVDGARVSGHGTVATLIEVFDERLPAASAASIAT